MHGYWLWLCGVCERAGGAQESLLLGRVGHLTASRPCNQAMPVRPALAMKLTAIAVMRLNLERLAPREQRRFIAHLRDVSGLIAGSVALRTTVSSHTFQFPRRTFPLLFTLYFISRLSLRSEIAYPRDTAAASPTPPSLSS